MRDLPFPLSNHRHLLTGEELFLFFLVIVALLAILLAITIFRKSRSDKKSMLLSDKAFAEAAEELRLSELEKKLIMRIGKRTRRQPIDIVSAPYIFELAVHKFIDSRAGEVEENRLAISSIRRKCGFDCIALGQPLFSSRNIGMPLKGKLIFQSRASDERIMCTICDTNESFMTVNPDAKETVESISAGTEVELLVQQPGDAEYTFLSKVIGNGSDRSIKIAHTIDFRRKQLREFLRVSIDILVKFRFAKTVSDKERLIGGTRFSGTTADISGGGMALVCANRYDIGDRIVMSFSLMGESFYGIRGDILKVKEKDNSFIHQIKFTEMEYSVQERLVRLIFLRHREDIQWERR